MACHGMSKISTLIDFTYTLNGNQSHLIRNVWHEVPEKKKWKKEKKTEKNRTSLLLLIKLITCVFFISWLGSFDILIASINYRQLQHLTEVGCAKAKINQSNWDFLYMKWFFTSTRWCIAAPVRQSTFEVKIQ